MDDSRRQWIRRLGIVIAGAGLARTNVLAMPATGNTLCETKIRLSSNENPYGPSRKAHSAMMDTISMSNRYQWQMIIELMGAIAQHHDVKKENVHIGAGSTQIIDNVIQLAGAQKGDFIAAEPTFSRWAGAAEKVGLRKISVPLTNNKRNDLPAMLKAIKKNTRFVYVCNPNNPTGTICSYEKLTSFVKEATKHTMVVVDEAYLDYANEPSLCGLAVKTKNLIVIRTFSKIYGLAGARIGYAVAHADTITRLRDLRSGADIDVSAASLAGAVASLKDERFVDMSSSKNEAAREFTIQELQKLSIVCIPSHTNFIYFSLANYEKDYFALLKANNIEGTMIFEESGKWTRITVGTMHEMERFIEVIK